MEVSKATVSRDFALVRRIHRQFGRMFGRSFDPKTDKIFWTWDWAYYGFMTPESTRAGFLKPVGHFPFDTRKHETEESYEGFTQLSWHNGYLASQLSTRDLIRVLTPIYRRQGRCDHPPCGDWIFHSGEFQAHAQAYRANCAKPEL